MTDRPFGAPPPASTAGAEPQTEGSWAKPGDPMVRRDPAMMIWNLSRRLHARGWSRAARVLKTVNFYLHHTLLPFQAEIGTDLRLEHHGMGVVMHPNTTIGDRVQIWHGVTFAARTAPGSPHRIRVGDNVVIGAGAHIQAKGDQSLVIGSGARIGAGAVVTGDVAPGALVVGIPARELNRSAEA